MLTVVRVLFVDLFLALDIYDDPFYLLFGKRRLTSVIEGMK
jgi:hypothetical protein